MRSMRSVVGILGCVLAVAANGSAQVSQVVAGQAITAAGINAIVDAVNTATTDITSIYGELGGTPSGNLNLEASTANTGNVLKGGVRFLHNYGTNNTFVGVEAGNFTMTGAYNTASGMYASIATPRARPTPPVAIRRSIATPRAATTRPVAIGRPLQHRGRLQHGQWLGGAL